MQVTSETNIVRKLYIIEHDAITAFMLKKFLDKEGFSPVLLNSIERLPEDHFPVIISDYRLAYSEIDSLLSEPKRKIILTAAGSYGISYSSERNVAFLRKPYRLTILLDLLKSEN